jgi:hypothetical protein
MFSPDTYTDDVLPNATCTDCGADFSRADHDPGTLCDPCSDRRDAHTSMLERRLVMAKATPPARPIILTPAEIALCVALIGLGWKLSHAIERVQDQRARLPFTNEAA